MLQARLWSTDTSSLSALSLLNPLLPLSVPSAASRSARADNGPSWAEGERRCGACTRWRAASISGSFGAESARLAAGKRRCAGVKGQLHTLEDLMKGEDDVKFWGVKRRKDDTGGRSCSG